MEKFHYNCPKGLMDGYDSVYIDQYCRWHCFQTYGGCSSKLLTSKVEAIDIPKVIEAISEIVQKNPKAKIFLDAPNFSDRRKILPDQDIDQHDQLLIKIISQGIKTYFRIETTVRGLFLRNEAYYRLLAKAGVKEVWLGVESVDQDLRNKYRKPIFTNRELGKIMKRLRELEIMVCWYLVVGVEDTEKTVDRTTRLIRRLKPDRIFTFQLFGYEIGEQRVSLGRIIPRAGDIDRWWDKLQKIACELDKKFYGR